MRWLKKWSYLLLLAGMGILYLSWVDKWQVYARPLQEAKSWYDNLWQQDALLAFGGGDGAESDISEGGIGVAEGDMPSSLPGNGAGGGNEALSDGSGEGADNPEEGKAVEGDTSTALPEGDAGQDGTAAGEGAGAGEDGGSRESSGAGFQEAGGEAPGENEGSEASEGEQNSDLPVYAAVEDDYFADAVFIGDSRTVGLFEYAGLEETAAFYASTGLTVYKMFDSEIVPVPGERKKITVEEALQQNTFAKIYLMIGINEMGTGTVETFLEKYREAVAHLQELQPDAIIYVQAIIKVTTERSDQGDYINNEGIVARNEGIAQMADNEKIFYLDVNPLICDETGGMISEYTFDGVHLKAKYIDIWKDYLKTHAISP